MMRRNRVHPVRVRRAEFGADADYARTVHEGGGPQVGDRWCFSGSDYHSQVMAAVWGVTEQDFARAVEQEDKLAQASRPHVFVHKWEPGRKKRTRRSRRG